METIKTFIIIVLAAGFTGAMMAIVNLWRIVAQAKKDYEDAAVDNTFTDAEYITLGKDFCAAVKECRTILEFIMRVTTNLKTQTMQAKIRIAASIYKLEKRKKK